MEAGASRSAGPRRHREEEEDKGMGGCTCAAWSRNVFGTSGGSVLWFPEAAEVLQQQRGSSSCPRASASQQDSLAHPLPENQVRTAA